MAERDGWQERDRPLTYHFDARSAVEPPADFDGRRAAIWRSIVAELLLAHYANPEGWVSYSRNKNRYGPAAHPLARHYKPVMDVVARLAADGWAEHWKAPQSPGGTGCQSRMRATPALLALVEYDAVELGNVAPLVRGRDENRRPILPPRDARVLKAEKALREINEARRSITVTVSNDCPHVRQRGPFLEWEPTPGHDTGAIVFPKQNQLYRSFTRDLNHGFRFYGDWVQGVPGAPKRGRDWGGRSWLLIDGEQTAEPDISAQHARLLYTLIGRPLLVGPDGKPRAGEDPYTVDGWERNTAKIAFQVMLNARSRQGAIKRIALDLGGDNAHKRAAALYEALEAKNRPIAGYFGSGIGLQLQRIDADMAEWIMLRLLRRHGVAVIPVHDSFVCRERDRPLVEEAMNDAWPNVAEKARLTRSS